MTSANPTAKRTSKRRLAISLLLFVAVSTGACAPPSERWAEEVRLSDGRTIIIERETVLTRGGDEWAHNRAGVKPGEYRIRFSAPDGTGQTIEWKSLKQWKTWPEFPLMFDIESGQPTVTTITTVSPGCEGYSEYRYQNGIWVEHPLPETFEQRATNLLIRSGTDMPKFVSLEDKRQGNKNVSYRRSLKNVGPNRKVCGYR